MQPGIVVSGAVVTETVTTDIWTNEQLVFVIFNIFIHLCKSNCSLGMEYDVYTLFLAV